MARKRIDLSRGGKMWMGWYLAPHKPGHDWRLYTPNGERSFSAWDLLDCARAAREIDCLRIQVNELRDFAHPDAMHVGPRDSLSLVEAAEIILRAAKGVNLARMRQRLREENRR